MNKNHRDENHALMVAVHGEEYYEDFERHGVGRGGSFWLPTSRDLIACKQMSRDMEKVIKMLLGQRWPGRR